MRLRATTRTVLTLALLLGAAPSHARAPEVCHPIRIRTGNALPVAPGFCPGVRPGGLIQTSIGECTLNFVFRGSDGHQYVGTAGHCLIGDGLFASDVGERTWKWPKGPIVRDGIGLPIGRAVYAVLDNPKDFALIRLNPGVKANPAMCHFGGPTSGSAPNGVPAVLHYFGNGMAVGSVLPARSAVATNLASPDHVYAQGIVVPGDSGGGVIDAAGRAVGVIVTTGLHLDRFSDPGTMGITRLQPQLARASAVLKIRFTLRTAKLV